jgi:hypothetical protein
MTVKIASMALGGALLLAALNVHVCGRPGPDASALPTLHAGSMRQALGQSCPPINVIMQSYCGSTNPASCTPATAPANCCTSNFAFTCPTTPGWASAQGQQVNGTFVNPPPACPTAAAQEYPCKCNVGKCTSGTPVPETCTGATYNTFNKC